MCLNICVMYMVHPLIVRNTLYVTQCGLHIVLVLRCYSRGENQLGKLTPSYLPPLQNEFAAKLSAGEAHAFSPASHSVVTTP